MTDSQPDTASTTPVSASLDAALAKFQISLSVPQVARLNEYCRRLWEWNEKINLTRHTDFDKFVARDVVDSLRVAEQLAERTSLLDVGTGGGVPGMIVAILRPDLEVVLSESIAKKSRVVAEIVERMDLPVRVFAGRAESLLENRRFDNLVVRAVAPLAKLVTWFKPHWPNIGRLLVVKGPAWVDERAEARSKGLMHDLELRKLSTWQLHGAEVESVLLAIWPREKHG